MCEVCVSLGFMTQEDFDKTKEDNDKAKGAVHTIANMMSDFELHQQLSILMSVGIAIMMENKIPPFTFVQQIKMAIDATWQNYNEENLAKIWHIKRQREKLRKMDDTTDETIN